MLQRMLAIPIDDRHLWLLSEIRFVAGTLVRVMDWDRRRVTHT